MSHTKGPWIVKDPVGSRKIVDIMASSGRRIAKIIRHPGDEPHIPMKDFHISKQDAIDATLIAAAPEMLEALETVAKRLRLACEESVSGGGYMLEAFHPEIESIIRKARGEK
jgi:hypothetical protein